jgi:hypothetical protein
MLISQASIADAAARYEKPAMPAHTFPPAHPTTNKSGHSLCQYRYDCKPDHDFPVDEGAPVESGVGLRDLRLDLPTGSVVIIIGY